MSLQGIAFGFACILGLCFVFSLLAVPFQPYPKLLPGQKLYSTTDVKAKRSYREILRKKPQIDFRRFVDETKVQIKGFLTHALTRRYIAFCFIPVFGFIRNSYYGVSFKKHLPNATNLYAIINPLSMLPCPLLGVLADRISTALTAAFIALCGSLSMLLVMFENAAALEYISIWINFIFISYVVSQVSVSRIWTVLSLSSSVASVVSFGNLLVHLSFFFHLILVLRLSGL